VVCFIGTLDLTQHYNLGYGPAMALTVARAAPIVLAPSRPRTAWWTELTAVVATAALTRPHSGSEPWPWAVTSLLTIAAVLTVVGSRTSRRATFAMWLEVLAAGALLVALVSTHDGWIGLLPMSVALAVAAVTADAVRGRGEAQARLANAEQISAAEQARATLLAERARIARELHDVVAHHMSVITVQADSAPYRIPDVPAAAAEEFAAIATEARRSLAEMRRLLHVLRSEESPDGEHTPQPGLPDLDTLIETTRRAGIDARLVVADDVPTGTELPAVVGLSAYRLVQEALSNVVRHAPGARANVSVDYVHGSIRIGVVNSSATGARPAVETRAGGHGLVGMQERVAMLDGELTAQALSDGGFHLTAVLPLSGTP
jgi:signal transduction histidine kinase